MKIKKSKCFDCLHKELCPHEDDATTHCEDYIYIFEIEKLQKENKKLKRELEKYKKGFRKTTSVLQDYIYPYISMTQKELKQNFLGEEE